MTECCHPIGDVPVEHEAGPSGCFLGAIQQQAEASVDHLTPAGETTR